MIWNTMSEGIVYDIPAGLMQLQVGHPSVPHLYPAPHPELHWMFLEQVNTSTTFVAEIYISTFALWHQFKYFQTHLNLTYNHTRCINNSKKGIFKNGVYVINDEKREFLRTTHAHWGQPSVPVLPSVYPFLQLSIHCMVWEQVRTLAGGAVGGWVGAVKKLPDSFLFLLTYTCNK